MKSEKEHQGCLNLFLLVTAILGFIVDSIALIALLFSANIDAISMPQFLAPPTVNLELVTFEWADLTLVLLIYVGFSFALIAIRARTSITSQIPFDLSSHGIKKAREIHHHADQVYKNWIVLLSHMFGALLLLWLMIFIPFGSGRLYLHIAEAWLFGLIIALILRTKNFEISLHRFVIVPLIVLLIVSPGWFVLEVIMYDFPWWTAIVMVLTWGLTGVLVSYIF